ncbi:MAG TPA: hypothetical protein V6C72_01830 [Chroococcales cyanobacterium]
MATKKTSQALSSLLLCAATICGTASPAPAETFSIPAAIALLKNSNVLKSSASLRATYDNKNKRAVLLTDRMPKATDDDCKIDSVLLAKKLMDSFPEDVNQVRVIFNKPGGSVSQHVDVSKVDVKAYGTGAVKASELLGSLTMVNDDIDQIPSSSGESLSNDNATVVPGPFAGQRLILLGRIEQLRKRGTGVKPFETLFAQIEDQAKAGDDAKLKASIPYLSEKLGEQEKLVKQAAAPKSHPQMAAAGSTAATGQGAAAVAGSGNVELDDVLRRCKDWDLRISEMRRKGVDAHQLEGLLLFVRTMAANPSSMEVARKTLDQMDEYGNHPGN